MATREFTSVWSDLAQVQFCQGFMQAGPYRTRYLHAGDESKPALLIAARDHRSRQPDGAWRGRRVLTIDDKPAFELSYWCGTCQFLFQRLEGATTTFSADPADPLTDGARGLDDELISRFAALLPEDHYRLLTLQVEPRLVHPARPGDYFAEEQVATWGLEPFWGLPAYPRTPYYRTYETTVAADAHLYEFVVPMVPPSWNDRETVAAYTAELLHGVTPTAIAVSILDVCAPAVEHGPDYHTHWALTHFLLDGHHRMQAAAETARPIRLLSLLAVNEVLASAEEVERLPTLRAASPRSRPQQ